MIFALSRTLLILALSFAPLVAAAEPAAQSGAHAIDAGMKPHDLSVWSMFVNADIVVKIVMLGLLAASIACWSVLIAKTFELKRARRSATDAVEKLSDARGLSEARLALGPAERLSSAFLAEATRELRLSSDIPAGAGIKERIAACFAEIERAEQLAINRGTGLLASVGSTGPFVGLFGTVWGIMNSFIGISKAQSTNLAVVAPGIAEALLATAVGLFAAIPAVLIYNHLARQSTAYLELVSNVSGELLRIVSRDLDRAGQAPTHAGSTKIHAAE
jgi:biopolymer transport protein ExbB